MKLLCVLFVAAAALHCAAADVRSSLVAAPSSSLYILCYQALYTEGEERAALLSSRSPSLHQFQSRSPPPPPTHTHIYTHTHSLSLTHLHSSSRLPGKQPSITRRSTCAGETRHPPLSASRLTGSLSSFDALRRTKAVECGCSRPATWRPGLPRPRPRAPPTPPSLSSSLVSEPSVFSFFSPRVVLVWEHRMPPEAARADVRGER